MAQKNFDILGSWLLIRRFPLHPVPQLLGHGHVSSLNSVADFSFSISVAITSQLRQISSESQPQVTSLLCLGHLKFPFLVTEFFKIVPEGGIRSQGHLQPHDSPISQWE